MKKPLLLCLIALTCIALSSCINKNENKNVETNLLLKPFDTPYGVPPFDKIKNSDFLPAFQFGIDQQNAEIEAIINNTDTPNFENTIWAFDKSGEDLNRITSAFMALFENHCTQEIQQLAETIFPMLSQHEDNITMNDQLFQKIKSVYDNRENLNLDSDQMMVVNKYYEDFVRNGANLSAENKEQLKKVNLQLSSLFLKFSSNLLAETNNFKLYIDNPDDLSGLPKEIIDQAALAAENDGKKGKWLFSPTFTSMLPFLQFSDRRDLREKLYRGYFMRGLNNNANDNRETVDSIINLRVRKAHLLGYNSYGQYQIAANMAKDADVAYNFILDIYNQALKVAKNEVVEMQQIINKEGGKFKLASWDWWYYAEKVRKAKYDLDENELKPYFKLENVRDGMFLLTNKLYGLKFEKLEDIPTYFPDVEVFKVTEANNDLVGLIYLDYYPRPEKGQGAWCESLRNGTDDINGKRVYPIATITCNFPKPTADAPSLLSFDDAETLFHEFGHAVQNLFSYNKYSRISGNFPRDMVELPSQIMENWCSEPEMLRLYARHYQTNEVIPDELINKIVKSSTFNTGFNTTELLAASLLDLKWHAKTIEKTEDVVKFESDCMKEIHLIDEILPRYRSTYFKHIFDSDGYAAGYYVYTWAEVLDKDAFQAFKETGDIFNKEIAARFRNYVLTNIGQDEPMAQYVKFRGKQPSNEPYLRARGLK